jgi:hypothetical protein
VLRYLALGVIGAYGAQAAFWGQRSESWFGGPGLVVRTNPDGGTPFVSAATGVAYGHYRGWDSYDSYSFSGFGVALSAGWIGRAGPVELGGSLKMDTFYVDAGDSRTLDAWTANFIVGFSPH